MSQTHSLYLVAGLLAAALVPGLRAQAPAEPVPPGEDLRAALTKIVDGYSWPQAADGRGFDSVNRMSRSYLNSVARDAAKLAEAIAALHQGSPLPAETRQQRLEEDLAALKGAAGAYTGMWLAQYSRAARLPSAQAFENLAREARRAGRREDPFEDSALPPALAVAAAQRHWVEALGEEMADAANRPSFEVATVLAAAKQEAQTRFDQGSFGKAFLDGLKDRYADLRADHEVDASLLEFGRGLPLQGEAQQGLEGFGQQWEANGAALDAFRDWLNRGAPPERQGPPVAVVVPEGPAVAVVEDDLGQPVAAPGMGFGVFGQGEVDA